MEYEKIETLIGYTPEIDTKVNDLLEKGWVVVGEPWQYECDNDYICQRVGLPKETVDYQQKIEEAKLIISTLLYAYEIIMEINQDTNYDEDLLISCEKIELQAENFIKEN